MRAIKVVYVVILKTLIWFWLSETRDVDIHFFRDWNIALILLRSNEMRTIKISCLEMLQVLLRFRSNKRRAIKIFRVRVNTINLVQVE
jgi:hypothetical protein